MVRWQNWLCRTFSSHKITEYYHIDKNGLVYHHKIDGPSFIIYQTDKREKVDCCYYYIYDKQFYPWWFGSDKI